MRGSRFESLSGPRKIFNAPPCPPTTKQHPVTWQSSADGSKWIGHMILKKTVLESGGEKRDSSAILGLKVIGGTASDTGKLGAFITKVKKGSIADTVGHLRPVINAIDLPLTDGGKFRDPYCKIYLLPDRSEKSKRRTKTVSATIDPTWNQTFIYCPVKESDLHDRLLEITVWDYDRVGASEFLGEILIDLTTANLNDEPYWYQLDHHDNTSIPLPASSPRTKSSQDPYDLRKDHLSPPVSTRGLSDSDMSEMDFDDGIGVVPETGYCQFGPPMMLSISILISKIVSSGMSKVKINYLFQQKACNNIIGGAVAHLVGQLATKSEVRGSNPSRSQVNFSIAPLCPPSTKWVARSLKARRK
ncbi:regulating synaptic membrane exocytosis protein 2 [Plakobranchus ocellatus]|uniref:Regulating synaptic membrane exocytosis protein 2 n=1 Tax=Plakobranchus ocellatus TaxID=259542 RepID=A0AAV3Z6Y8_9GAST|nr:regulating synaptic membrane exocytosis protein 2 [Plakobranchus ocellatus]